MQDPRNFWEKLFRRKEKTVKSLDAHGNVLSASTYTFDNHGGIIGKTDFSANKQGHLVKTKDKTYSRQKDGSYDPDTTVYFDSFGFPLKKNQYSRRDDGMLCCTQEKYTHVKGEDLLVESSYSTYDGGLWTTRRKETCEYDDKGHVVHESYFKLFSESAGLVCVKDKKWERNEDGVYDPKETTYRDEQGRITKQKSYHREQTELDKKPILFADETTYDYSEKEAKSDTKKYAHMGILWVSMEEYQAVLEQTRQEKEKRIQKLEPELADLKGEKKQQIDPQQLKSLRSSQNG